MAVDSLFCFFSFFLFFTLLIITRTSAAWPPAAPPKASSNGDTATNSTDFIRTSCQATLYPELCFASFARYALSVHQNPVRLAHIAARVTFFQIHSTTSHVSAYLHGSSTEREAAALEDCVYSLGNAADQTRRSAAEIGKLDRKPVGPEVAWRVSNAQTWMSAALTNEETCTDGLDKVDVREQVKADVFSRVGRAKQYTSNALALVNCLVNGR